MSYSISPSWSNFVEPYGYVVLLEPVDPMFKKIGAMFIKEQLYPPFAERCVPSPQ